MVGNQIIFFNSVCVESHFMQTDEFIIAIFAHSESKYIVQYMCVQMYTLVGSQRIRVSGAEPSARRSRLQCQFFHTCIEIYYCVLWGL